MKASERRSPTKGARGGAAAAAVAGSPPAAVPPPDAVTLPWGETGPLGRREWIFLAVLTVAGLILRLWRLGMPAMWGDELGSLSFALQPVRDIFLSEKEVFPPIHFLLIHYSVRLFGLSEWAARFPCAMLGMLAVPVQYLLARRLFGRTVGAISSVLLCLSMYHVFYCRDAHSYGMYAFFAIGSLHCFCAILLTTGRRPLHWIGYVVFSALMVLTHFIGAVACLEQALIAAALVCWRIASRKPWAGTRRLLAGFTASGVAVGLGLVFYLPKILSITRGETVATKASQLLKITPHFLFYVFTRQGFGNGAGLALFAALLAAGLALAFRRSWVVTLAAVLWTVFPFALFATVELGHWAEPRYFIFTYPAVMLICALGVECLRRGGLFLSKGRRWGYAVPAAAALLWAVKMLPAYRDFYAMNSHDDPKREMAEWMRANLPPGSLVMYGNQYDLRWVGPTAPLYRVPDRTFVFAALWNYAEDYIANRVRDRMKAFLDKFPEAAFYYNDEYREKLGLWSYPREKFARHQQFANWPGYRLAARGLFHLDNRTKLVYPPADPSVHRVFVRDIHYNTEEDLVARARGRGDKVLRCVIGGFGFWIEPRQWVPFLVITREGRVAVHRLDAAPRMVSVEVNAAAINAERLDVVGPAGVLGSVPLVNNEMRTYRVAVAGLPPGRTEIGLRVTGAGDAQPALLCENIIVRAAD